MNNGQVFNVKNRSAGTVVYKIPELNVRRVFTPGEVKRISYGELEALSFAPGGKELIAEYLQVRSAEALNQLNVNVEQEYFMDRDQVVTLIKSGTDDQWIDALNFAPAGVIELIKQLSVEIPLADYNKRKILKDKLGFDVDAAIKNSAAADAVEETIVPVSPMRRSATAIVDEAAKAEAEKPVQNSTDKYKIISEG
jgi:hypothetical protein